MTRQQPRKPANGFKKKIARLEARIAELEQALAEAECGSHKSSVRRRVPVSETIAKQQENSAQ